MQFNIVRDFLDGILFQHPVQKEGAKHEVKANSGVHFLPSNEDKTLHTAIISFALLLDDSEKPYVQAGWRFQFQSSEAFEPSKNQQTPFFGQLLVLGGSKIITVVNSLCLHAGTPMVPFSAERLVAQIQQQANAQQPS